MKKLLILSPLLLLGSCASKHKEVHSVSSSLKYSAAVDTTFSFKDLLKYQAALQSQRLAEKKYLFLQYEGCEGDSIEYKEYGPDGKLTGKTVLKGKGKAILRNTSAKENVSEAVQASGSAEHSGTASGAKKIASDATFETLDKTVTIKPRRHWWLWLLLLIPVFLFMYLNKKYGWLLRLKSHVTGLFH